MDVKQFYLNNQIDRDKYIMIQLSMILQEFVEKYNHVEKSHNGYIYARVTKVMYGFPQAEQLSQNALLKNIEPYGDHPFSQNPRLWKHKSQQINFTLVVDGFGVKYSGKEHALHLKAAQEKKIKITSDWEGKLYIELALKWDYEK